MRSTEIKARIFRGLREKKLKLTSQRREIIDIFAHDKSHPNALDIYKKATKKKPKISLSTVYYTLDILKREGLIKELEFCDKDNRYEGDISDHLNLVCTECRKIEDFKARLPVSSELVEDKTGFKVGGMRFEYYGLCKECGKKRG